MRTQHTPSQKLKRLANRFANQVRRNKYPGISETSRGKCTLCRLGSSNGAHTVGVRRFRYSWWVPLSATARHLGAVHASPELCVACTLEAVQRTLARRK